MKVRTWVAFLCLLLLTSTQGAKLRRRLRQDCSECEDGCPIIAFLIGGENLSGPLSYMGSVRGASGGHICGGTLIAKNVFLTAAHCLSPGQTPRVHLGRFSRVSCDSFGFESFGTVESIFHPQYDKAVRNDFDVALLVLDSESQSETIPLATSDSCFESTSSCPVRLLGWGHTVNGGSPASVLQEAFTTSVSRATCEQQLGASRISNSMICAGELDGGVDACQGDSGGPMIENGRQVGIVSWGVGCALAGKPGVYTSIPKVRSWIDDEIAKLSGSQASGCDCSYTGVSGGVSTARIGCNQHLLSSGDSGAFCMVQGGVACTSATPSTAFSGAAWKDCSLGDPCHCTDNGFSGGVSTSRIGCKQHLLSAGDTDTFCMVQGGLQCSSASPSQPFQGAAWKLCG